jgi:uncharacterized protein (UPF0333 family)
MKQYILAILVALSAFAISAAAAFYSITGLVKLFAGVGFAIYIMATALEVSKLVIASLLYQYWQSLNRVLRAYLVVALIVLMVITSAGIYGLLSSGYQVTANKLDINKATVENIEKKKALFLTQKDALEQELALINTNLNDLRKSGSTSITEQVYDRKTKQYITKAVKVPAKFIEKQIDVVSNQKSDKDDKLTATNDSIFAYESRILELKTNDEVSAEIGPLIYLSAVTGRPMDVVINWFLLLIIFVFDPLAIALVISANFLFARISNSKKPELPIQIEPVPIETQVESMREVVESYDDLQSEIEKFVAPEVIEPVEEIIPSTYEAINQHEQLQKEPIVNDVVVTPPPKVHNANIPRLSEEQKKWMTAEQIANYNKQFDE